MSNRPVFELGEIIATPAALEFCDSYTVDLRGLLDRHQSGDCGEMNADDVLANMDVILRGRARVFSSYAIGSQKIWIITEADRSSTTILLPSDY
jgi:hypothetical protein